MCHPSSSLWQTKFYLVVRLWMYKKMAWCFTIEWPQGFHTVQWYVVHTLVDPSWYAFSILLESLSNQFLWYSTSSIIRIAIIRTLIYSDQTKSHTWLHTCANKAEIIKNGGTSSKEKESSFVDWTKARNHWAFKEGYIISYNIGEVRHWKVDRFWYKEKWIEAERVQEENDRYGSKSC